MPFCLCHVTGVNDSTSTEDFHIIHVRKINVNQAAATEVSNLPLTFLLGNKHYKCKEKMKGTDVYRTLGGGRSKISR